MDLRLAGNESAEAWGAVIPSLVERHLGVPEVAVIEGSAGLREALQKQRPKLMVQRCSAHKLFHLTAKVPAALGEEIAEDYHWTIYAQSAAVVEAERKRFHAEWQKLCMGVITSLDEAGEGLHCLCLFFLPLGLCA